MNRTKAIIIGIVIIIFIIILIQNSEEITINIFSLNGRIIKTIKTSVPSTGYSIPPVSWNGNDDSGRRVGKGIYPYTVTIKVSEGTGGTARATGRMIIL